MWYAMFFAALLSADSLGVGLTLGTNKTKIPPYAKLAVTAVSFVFASLSCFAGMGGKLIMKPHLCDAVSGVLLTISGLFLLLGALKGTANNSDRDGSGEISVKEALFMGVALSSDMLSAGTGFACGENATLLFPVFAGTFQFLFLSFGELAGKKMKVPLWLKEKIIPFLPPVAIIIPGVIKISDALLHIKI